MEFKELMGDGAEHYLPNISVDCVIFGFHENQLKVLLNLWRNAKRWCLPGGYILRQEAVDDSAKRILKERTGLSKIYLQQFNTFGSPNRVKRSGIERDSLSSAFNVQIDENNWLFDRFVSVGYYALVEYSKAKPKPDTIFETCEWFDIHSIPKMLFDHNEIFSSALKALRLQLFHQPVGFNLLPEKFTLPELLGVYETILDKKLDRRNFQKKILSFNFLIKLDERRNIGPHRAPTLYSFDKQKYNEAAKQGLNFIF